MVRARVLWITLPCIGPHSGPSSTPVHSPYSDCSTPRGRIRPSLTSGVRTHPRICPTWLSSRRFMVSRRIPSSRLIRNSPLGATIPMLPISLSVITLTT